MSLRAVGIQSNDFLEQGKRSDHRPALQRFSASRNRALSRARSAFAPPVRSASSSPHWSIPPQQCLNFLPLPHGQGLLRPTFLSARSRRLCSFRLASSVPLFKYCRATVRAARMLKSFRRFRAVAGKKKGRPEAASPDCAKRKVYAIESRPCGCGGLHSQGRQIRGPAWPRSTARERCSAAGPR